MSSFRPIRTTLIAAGIAVALVGCSAQDAETSPSGSASAATEATTTITLYTSEPEAKIQQIIDAFEGENPDVTVEVFRAGTGDLTARIESERASGEVQADVLLAADAATFEGYVADELLLQYSPADVDALDPSVVDDDGYYTGTRIIPTVIAYNTGIVDAPPSSWKELTDSEWSGKIVMPNPDVSGAAAYNAAVWSLTPELGDSWLEALAANQPLIVDSNGPVSEAVAAGTQPVGVVVDYLVRDLAAQGSPLAVSYPSEGVPYVSEPVGIFASTDAEDASKRFVDFLVSKEGQQLAVEQNYLPVRSDVGTPEGAPALDEIATLDPSLDEVLAQQDAAVERFNALFG